jgi:hypothetical protein
MAGSTVDLSHSLKLVATVGLTARTATILQWMISLLKMEVVIIGIQDNGMTGACTYDWRRVIFHIK